MMTLPIGYPLRAFAIFCSLAWGCVLGSWQLTAHGDDEIYAVQSRASTPNFQLLLNLADDSSEVASGPLFGPPGGVFGLTFLDDTLYAVEFANGSSDKYLATIPHDPLLFGQGSRVGSSPIGFDNVESLAAADGILYATSINFSTHRSTLITIDPSTGIGSSVGEGDFDVILVGLAFDPDAEILYGAGIPFGGTGVDTPNLYTLDRGTGDTTLVGDLGVELQSLAWDADLGLIGAWDHLYDVDSDTGAASQIGTTDFTDGIPDMFNGIYSLAAKVTETSVDADLNMDGYVDGLDLGILLGNFNQSGIPAAGGELNGSPPVDGLDLGILLGAWSPPALVTTVPEPSALALVATAGLFCWRPRFSSAAHKKRVDRVRDTWSTLKGGDE